MACYVDTVREYPTAGLRFTEFCHLLADTRDERLSPRSRKPRRPVPEPEGPAVGF